MKKENLITLVMAILIGFIGGYLVFSIAGKKQESLPGGGVPPGAGSPMDYQQRIAEAEKIVAREPGNLKAWIQLGNDYFDTEQLQKAINAYGKALDLDPNNPAVLTDQGVMFRKAGWFDKALTNFEKAQKLDPQHEQSLINIGVVYAEDMKQPDKALKAWSRFVELHPTSASTQQVRTWMEQLKASPQAFKAK